MCNVFHAQTLYVTADILSGSGAEHSSEMKFGQSAHRTQRVGIQYLRQMTVDVHYYVLNHLMMKAACLLLLPPSPDPVWPDYYTHDFVLSQTDTYKYRSSPEHPVIHQAL